MKKNSKNTKGKIVTAAWKLFYEQGYDNTTVEEIIDESGTSKAPSIITLKERTDFSAPFRKFLMINIPSLWRKLRNL